MGSRKDTPDHVLVGELRIGYRKAGDGPPLVLLHGGLVDSRAWRDQLEDLSDEFMVVVWDAPGCGSSSDPPDTFRLADYAYFLAGLIEALGLHRPHVLGHSFGAGLALELFRSYPSVPGRSFWLARTPGGPVPYRPRRSKGGCGWPWRRLSSSQTASCPSRSPDSSPSWSRPTGPRNWYR